MKASEMRTKSDAELHDLLLDLRRKQFNLRMQQATQQLTNTSQISAVRKDVARVKTMLGKKVNENV